MDDDFYKNIRGFGKFAELTNPDCYTPVPDGWYIVMTDIEGSTEAITAGRYKDVNLAGAAAIIAVLNISDGITLPYVFGGDGATLLIPAALLDKTRNELGAVCAKVKATFGLTLRAGCVSLHDLYERGATLGVAKFDISPHISQAMFQGTALALAEQWMKKGNGPVLICGAGTADNPDLTGLECRWQPIHNRNGLILSLMVRVQKDFTAQAREIYTGIIGSIEDIYPDYTKASPVHVAGLNIGFSPKVLKRDVQLRSKDTYVARLARYLKVCVINTIGQLSFKSGSPVGSFDGQQYLSEMVANSDTRKFDEMLRMVIDSTPAQHQALEKMLREREAKGEIAYGIHVSSQALMTCLVFNIHGNHIHFIDGADGGYAVAAKKMKGQTKG